MVYILVILFNIFICYGKNGEKYIELGLKNKHQLDMAQKYFKKSLEEFKNERDKFGTIRSYYYIGYTYELQSNFKLAITNYIKAIQICK